MDEKIRKQTLRMIPYGLYVLTSRTESGVNAATVSWLSQASFEPPRIVVGLRAETGIWQRVRAAGAFAVNVVGAGQKELASTFFRHVELEGDTLGGYAIHAGVTGAPILDESHPTLGNLVGRVEHLAQMGTLVTDFLLIKPGALHKANGGYLLLDARKVLIQPFAWEALKRALKAGEITIESPGDELSLVSTVSLEPDPIPLRLKAVLFGDRMLYYMLCALDPEFPGKGGLELGKGPQGPSPVTGFGHRFDESTRRGPVVGGELQSPARTGHGLVDPALDKRQVRCARSGGLGHRQQLPALPVHPLLEFFEPLQE